MSNDSLETLVDQVFKGLEKEIAAASAAELEEITNRILRAMCAIGGAE